MKKYLVTIPTYGGATTRLQFPDADSFKAFLKERADVAELFGVRTEFTVKTLEVQPDGTTAEAR